MKKNKIKLGVNIDHAATLRQVRGGTTSYPDLVSLVRQSARAGADQITIHLREDRRHIQLSDLVALSKSCPVSLNLEMAVTPEMTKIARKYKPDWVCLVPEKRQELTTEGGLDVVKNAERIKSVMQRLQPVGIEISFFIGPDLKQVQKSFELGADAVEFHTGHWVAYKGEKKEKEWNRLVKAAKLCHYLGMRVHAGHGLDYATTLQVKKLPFLQEVNIGHSIISYAVQDGITPVIRKFKKILK